MKRIIAMLLALVMLGVLLPQAILPASAEEATSGTCGADGKVTWSFDKKSGELTIAGKGAMDDFYNHNDGGSGRTPWYAWRYDIKKITINGKITRIGEYAFENLFDAVSVSIPDTVTEIGPYAFYDCDRLESVTLPKNLKVLSYGTFTGCESLKSVNFNEGLTEIQDYVFEGCPALAKISFPSTLKAIGEGAFFGCTALKSVSFNEGLTEIGEEAFFYCENLRSVKLPESLVSLWDGAFMGCSALTEVTLPKNLKNLGGLAFAECKNLQRVICKSNTPYIYLYWVYHGKVDESTFFEPEKPMDIAEITKDRNLFPNMLGPNDQVEVYGYSKGAEGDYRTETVPVLDDNGKLSSEKGKYSRFISDYAKDAGYKFYPLDTFVDVADGKFYQIPVAWAAGNKITSGIDATHFAPAENCTRAQVVTFLWRAAGKPTPKTTKSPFKDVQDPKSFYYKAVLWAVENKITSGTTATTFSPDEICTRAQVVTFLWRALGKPAAKSSKCPFTDVNSGGFYYKAMLWAVESGVTSGTSNTTFEPETNCNRGQVVTFLYRSEQTK